MGFGVKVGRFKCVEQRQVHTLALVEALDLGNRGQGKWATSPSQPYMWQSSNSSV